MKIGVNFSIDVTKLDKSRIVSGKNGGKYVDLTCFISPSEPDKYGQHGGIVQSTTSDERQAGTNMPFCGNVKAFWSEGITIVKDAAQTPAMPASQPKTLEDFNEDIPF